jgi:hypothetical protein
MGGDTIPELVLLKYPIGLDGDILDFAKPVQYREVYLVCGGVIPSQMPE